MQNNNTEPHLKRSISLPLVIFYGIGTILGAGIYVLVGKVAGEAGMATPFAFLLASLLAGFSAFSYAELASRYPRSAGEAVYLQAAFGKKHFSLIMGLLIIAIGMVSAATMIHGFVGYLGVFVDAGHWLTKLLLVVVLASIVTWGIGQSVIFASALTVIEIIGLIIIIWVTKDNLANTPEMMTQFLPSLESPVLVGVLMGTFIAFYAFVGFEDIVNVAEEVINPVKNLPRAVIWSLIVTTLFYFIISIAAVITLSPAELASSDAPLAKIYEYQTGQQATVIAAISLLSVVNGALIQIVMASRVLYGLSEQQWIPGFFGHVNKTTRTPINATLVVSVVILALVMWLPLLSLAKLTSMITLVVFALINLALLSIKIKKEKHKGFSVPIWIPFAGFITCSSFVFFQIYQALTSQV